MGGGGGERMKGKKRKGNKEGLAKGGGKAEAIDVTERKEGQCQSRVLSNIKYCRGVVNKDRRLFIRFSEKEINVQQ